MLLGWTSAPTDAALQEAPPSHEAPRSLTDVLSSRLRFEENVGQASDRFAFVARARGYDVGISRAGLEVRVPGEAPAPARTVRLVFGDGGGHLATLVGEERLRSRAHYLHVGDGPAFHAAHFGRVRARGVGPGVDVVYRSQRGALEYDLVLGPHVDPRSVHVDVDGADRVTLNDEGEVVIEIGGVALLQRAPVVYQELGATRVPVPARVHVEDRRISFSLGRYDEARPLVIDPVLELSTYFGGAGRDELTAVEVDTAGNLIVAGYAETAAAPFGDPDETLVTSSAGGGLTSGGRVIAKLMGSGILLWYTVLADAAPVPPDVTPVHGLAVAESGRVWLSGYALGDGAPPFRDCQGGFALVLSREGDRVESLRCPQEDAVTRAIALDPQGHAIVGGSEAHDFDVDGIDDTAGGTAGQVWLLELGETGGVARLFGGPGVEVLHDIAVAPTGDVWIGGSTTGQLPVSAGALQGGYGGGEQDGFLARLSSAGDVEYASYLGGAGRDEVRAVAFDASGNVWVAGSTSSADFPRAGPGTETSLAGASDLFITKLDPDGTTLVHSRLLGGAAEDVAGDLAVHPEGHALVVGTSASAELAGAQALQDGYGGGASDVVVGRVRWDGVLDFLTFLGGSGADEGHGITVDYLSYVTVVGTTTSADYPTNRPLLGVPVAKSYGGDTDGFITRLAVDLRVRVDPRGGSTSEIVVRVIPNMLLAGFDARLDFGPWMPLDRRDNLVWSLDQNVDDGVLVQFHARSAVTDQQASTGVYVWPSGALAPGDADGDGIQNFVDRCPRTPDRDQLDLDGDGRGDACDDDDDGDGVPDEDDVCPAHYDPEQLDLDGDGLGDACDDDEDACVGDPGVTLADLDEDGTPDACDDDDDGDLEPDQSDTCPRLAGADQADLDGDGRGDACDDDDDGDGIPDDEDNCPRAPNVTQRDTNGDGAGDPCDDEHDGDGVPDAQDNCPDTPNPDQTDLDVDGIGAACDEPEIDLIGGGDDDAGAPDDGEPSGADDAGASGDDDEIPAGDDGDEPDTTPAEERAPEEGCGCDEVNASAPYEGLSWALVFLSALAASRRSTCRRRRAAP